MDIQTLSKIESLVKDANRIEVIHPQAEPSHVCLVRNGVNLDRKEAAPATRKHVASSLDTLIAKAAETSEDSGAEVWVDRTGVVLLLDANRRDTVSYPLGLSDQVKALEAVATKPLSQKDIIFLLRTTFRDSLGLAGDIVPILRNVKFNAEQKGESEVQHGRSSVGKSITAEVTGTKALPEYVTLTVPVFAQAGTQQVREPVVCALEPDAATVTFRLIALPGEIEKAIGAGELQVKTMIEGGLSEGISEEANGSHVKVYLGKP